MLGGDRGRGHVSEGHVHTYGWRWQQAEEDVGRSQEKAGARIAERARLAGAPSMSGPTLFKALEPREQMFATLSGPMHA